MLHFSDWFLLSALLFQAGPYSRADSSSSRGSSPGPSETGSIGRGSGLPGTTGAGISVAIKELAGKD